MIQLNLPTGEPIRLNSSPARKFRGVKIPGSVLHKAERNGYAITEHEYNQDSFSLSFRSFHFPAEITLINTEKINWVRLETVLSGELRIKNPDGKVTQLLPGQYHLTDTPIFQTQFSKAQTCTYFSAYYSSEFLSMLGLPITVTPITPRPLPMAMQELIYEFLDNPFDNDLRPFYYGNCLRELLFMHVSSPPFAWPGQLTEKQIAAMYEVDRFIAENLEGKITIRSLAKMAGTNSFFLKKAYEQVFGIGIFPRLIQRRMERAQFLLENTVKPLKDICEMAGYETLAGFITEFRKRFGVTPNGWRKNRRRLK